MSSALLKAVIIASGLIPTLASISLCSGTVRTYRATFEVVFLFDDTLSPTISLGDKFTLVYTLDHDVTDSMSSTSEGVFLSATSEVSLSRAAANVGTWNPGAGVANLGAFTFNASPVDVFSVTTTSLAGFPAAEGHSLVWFSVDAEDHSNASVNDSGVGQTLQEQLGGFYDPALFSTFQKAFLRFDAEAAGTVICRVNSYQVDAPVAVESRHWGGIKRLFR